MLKKLIKYTAIAIVSLSIAFAIIFYLVLDTSAQTMQHHQVNTKTAKNAQALLQRVKRSFLQSKTMGNHANTQADPVTLPVTLVIKRPELFALSAILNRSNSMVLVESDIYNQQYLSLKLAIKLSSVNTIFSNKIPSLVKSLLSDLYVNVSLNILPSDQGLLVEQIKIGSITFPGALLTSTSRWLLNRAQPELGTHAFATIKAISITDKQLSIRYQLPKDLQLKGNDAKGRLYALRDELALFGDVKKVRFYYQRLLRFSQEKLTNKNSMNSYALEPFVAFMIQQAALQSNSSKVSVNNFIALKENQAALIALAIYFGSNKFELMVGEVSRLSRNEKINRAKLIRSVHLANRVDLQQHFIYSMAIKLFSTMQASHTFGELKELLDANTGGSGFSFADLMADRAGTQFAVLATLNEHSAINIQQFIAGSENKNFKLLPTLIDLPEGLNEQYFEDVYQNINSQRYKNMVEIIDTKLHSLPIFR